jgi:hypothetical protein
MLGNYVSVPGRVRNFLLLANPDQLWGPPLSVQWVLGDFPQKLSGRA